jgi:DNA-binding NarL/FixJ family response regulator
MPTTPPGVLAPRTHDADRGAAEAPRPPAQSALVVVSDDPALVRTLEAAVPDVAVVHARAPQELASLLLGRACATVFADLATVGPGAARLLPELARQFPELSLVAVGTRADEVVVSRLIAAGVLYRFLHRPVSPERARTFATAALRRAEELRLQAEAEAVVEEPPPPPRIAPSLPPPRRGRSPQAVSYAPAVAFAALTLVLAAAAASAWLTRPVSATAPDPVAVAPPTADLVGAANAAVGRDELLAPAGTNAAELFRQAFARRPDDIEAKASLMLHAEALLAAGERARAQGREDEAALAAAVVALVRPHDPRVRALAAPAAAPRSVADRTRPAVPSVAPHGDGAPGPTLGLPPGATFAGGRRVPDGDDVGSPALPAATPGATLAIPPGASRSDPRPDAAAPPPPAAPAAADVVVRLGAPGAARAPGERTIQADAPALD